MKNKSVFYKTAPLLFAISITTPSLHAQPVDTESVKTFTIVHTNDTHCRAGADKSSIGFARIKTVVDTVRSLNPNTIVIDGGDFIQGQLICSMDKGETIVNIMNQVGYDVTVIGNHEFIYGQTRLQELIRLLDYPVLGANVKYDDGSDYTKSYIIKIMDGVRIGIFGVTTQTITARPENIAGVQLLDPVATAKEMVTKLKADKADVIIALSHLGLNEQDRNHAQQLANEVEGIDMIIDAHSHTALEAGISVNNVLIAQTGHRTNNIGIINFDYGNGGLIAKKAALIHKPLADMANPNPEIEQIIAQANEKIERAYAETVGSASVKLNGDRQDVRVKETNLGDMMADMMRSKADADVAIIFAPLISASMGPGEITKKDLANILTEDFDVVTVEITGGDLEVLLEAGLKTYFQQVSGVKFAYDGSKPAEQRITGYIEVNGQALDKAKTYKLALVDWHYEESKNKNSLYHVIQKARYIGSIGSLNAMFEEYVRSHSPLSYEIDGRVKKLN